MLEKHFVETSKRFLSLLFAVKKLDNKKGQKANLYGLATILILFFSKWSSNFEFHQNKNPTITVGFAFSCDLTGART